MPNFLVASSVLGVLPAIDLAPERPEWVIIKEIDFRIDNTPNGDELVFFYSGSQPIMPVEFEDHFQNILADVCAPAYQFGVPVNVGEPSANELSLDGRERLAYVILKLTPRRRWQFARKGEPIRFNEDSASQIYHEARRVNAQCVADSGSDLNVIRDDCMVAYFISDGAKAVLQGDYSHGFNLYVDLKLSGEPMPIVIDPDVRHPGGSA